MKIFRTIGRSFRDAFKSVFRNFSLSVASISCITITLLIVSISIIVSQNVKNFTNVIEKDITIVVFLDNDITSDEIDIAKSQIEKIDNVQSISFKSKNTVKEEMMKGNETFANILSEWGDEENPLKDTFTVKVKDIDSIKNTANEIKKISKINTLQYGEGLIEKMVGAFEMLQKLTLIAAIALIVVTLFLIANTIKLTIFSRKTEISIMRLVGASNSRIKLPFMIEGIIIGIMGSIIPIIVTICGYRGLYKRLGGQVLSSLIKLIRPETLLLNISLVLLGIGILVGMIGSLRAVRKYIKA